MSMSLRQHGHPAATGETAGRPVNYTIRLARDEDADAISAVVIRTLRETNAKDYAKEIIERIDW
jgi:hypothetical protein